MKNLLSFLLSILSPIAVRVSSSHEKMSFFSEIMRVRSLRTLKSGDVRFYFPGACSIDLNLKSSTKGCFARDAIWLRQEERWIVEDFGEKGGYVQCETLIDIPDELVVDYHNVLYEEVNTLQRDLLERKLAD